MARGRLNKQIAHDLGPAERMVKMHRSAAQALGVRTAADAAAGDRGWFSPARLPMPEMAAFCSLWTGGRTMLG
jgi:hypothetical protein